MTNLYFVLEVLPARPNHHQNIEQENGTNKTHHHGVLEESSKKLSSASHIDLIGHDEERAPEKRQVGAQTLSEQGCGAGANLGTQNCVLLS